MAKSKKTTINDWTFATLFDVPVIKGWVYDCHVVQPVLWMSDWRVGTPRGVWKLGRELYQEWSWITGFTREERVCRRK